MVTSFNGKQYRVRKPKRSDRWTRSVDQRDFVLIHRLHKTGLSTTVISDVMQLNKELVETVLIYTGHNDYVRRPSDKPVPVAEEPAPDPTKSYKIPERNQKIVQEFGLHKLVQGDI